MNAIKPSESCKQETKNCREGTAACCDAQFYQLHRHCRQGLHDGALAPEEALQHLQDARCDDDRHTARDDAGRQGDET